MSFRYFGPFTLEETQRISAGFFRVSRPLSLKDSNDVSFFSFDWLEKGTEGVWLINGIRLNVNPVVKVQIQEDDSDIDLIFGDLITSAEKAAIKDKILNQEHVTLQQVIESSAAVQSREKTSQWLIDNGWIDENML